MNVLFSFDVGASHYARRLDLERDRAALAGLGRRCAGYLRQTTAGNFDADDAPRVFLKMLRPGRVPAERGFVLGIFRRHGAEGEGPPPPLGVLYFLHSSENPGTWYILLLLLAPEARGSGLGSAVHTAFEQWAAARGARRLVVAVSETNDAALRFWRDRLGYKETAAKPWREDSAACRRSRELEYRVAPALAVAPWMRLRV